MKKELGELLIRYADQYETPSFLDNDPSWFMHQVKGDANQETMAFIAGCLSYGSRKQFIPQIDKILHDCEGEPYQWVIEGDFEATIPDDQNCFYRLYTNQTFFHFLQTLRKLLLEYKTLGCFVATKLKDCQSKQEQALTALLVMNRFFKNEGLTGIVPQPVTSLCKRPVMFLRWMVRNNSPVDLGLWTDIIDKSSLYIPLDTHVMQTAQRLKIIKGKTASWATVVKLTDEMSKVFPGDPARGDYALYGANALGNISDIIINKQEI